MTAKRLLAAITLLLAAWPAMACPWCKLYGIKETISAGQADPGGRFFGQVPPPEKTRHYYIAAEPVLWQWAPLGVNVMKPLPLPQEVLDQPGAAKARYVQFTDATFTQRVLDEPRLGIVGPVLRGVVGEYLAVTFLNRCPAPLSIHPHGVRYDKDSEGAYADPGHGLGSAVGPGATFTYVWQLDETSGPQPDEPSSKCWLYHSHCKDEEEINLGLAGLIVVTDPKRARPDGTPVDVDREMPAMLYIFDETPEDEALEYKDADLAKPMVPRTVLQTMELRETSERHSINGLLFGNLPGLEMREGERVRWYLGTLGEEDGIHTAHWHGARVREDGRQTVDVISLLPGQTKVADQIADNPGTWLLHCHVSDHMMGGMFANFIVKPKTEPAPPQPFLGVPEATVSLRWTKAEAELDFTPETTAPARVALEGTISIYRGFFPRRNPLSVSVGGRSVPLAFTDASHASGDGTQATVLGANEQGVLLDETMSFELTLEGAAWRDQFAAAGLRAGTSGATEIPVELDVAGTRHAARLLLETSSEGGNVRARLRQ
jgi:hypothetical protein